MPTGKITALEVQKRNTERVNVYIDGEFAFGLNMLDAAHLHKGQMLTEADVTRLQYGDAVVKAVDRAAGFLAFRPRSRAEVRQNLTKHNTPEDVVGAAMERLESLGYLDDRAFARYWVENRDTFKPRGARALSAELREKGVPDAIIREVVATVDAFDAAYRAAKPRINRYRGGTVWTFKQKVSGFLARRGFDFDVIRDVLDQYIAELNEQEPDFFIEPDAEDEHP
jgi:regulatory protein